MRDQLVNVGGASYAFAQEILNVLQQRLEEGEDPAVRDNAVGALARLTSALGGKLPLDKIVPVIISSLPLQEDEGENVAAVRWRGS